MAGGSEQDGVSGRFPAARCTSCPPTCSRGLQASATAMDGLAGHHAPGPQRVHLLGRGRQARGDPRAAHPPDPGGAGGGHAPPLLLAGVRAPRAQRQAVGAFGWRAAGDRGPGAAGLLRRRTASFGNPLGVVLDGPSVAGRRPPGAGPPPRLLGDGLRRRRRGAAGSRSTRPRSSCRSPGTRASAPPGCCTERATRSTSCARRPARSRSAATASSPGWRRGRSGARTGS